MGPLTAVVAAHRAPSNGGGLPHVLRCLALTYRGGGRG